MNFRLEDMPVARALLKLAELPEPPPDFGEVPQEAQPAQQQQKQQPEPIKHPILHALKATLVPGAAFGAGYAGGYLGQLGIEKALGLKQKPGAVPVLQRQVAPILGGMFGLAYQQYKSREHEELRRAFEAYKSRSQGSVPSE